MRFIRVRKLQKLHLGFAGWLLVLALLGLGAAALGHPSRVSAAAGCDNANIIRCGLDPTSLQNTIDSFQGNYVNGCFNRSICDLKQVYAWAGATKSSVMNMNTSNTKAGTLYNTGEIKVDGKTVGVDAWVAARFRESKGVWVQISPGVWARKATTSLAGTSAPVIVHFSGGKADYAIMVNCGNAVKFSQPPTPPAPAPVLVCDNLRAREVGNTLQYTFHATASASHTTIRKYVFGFGDNTAVGTVTTANQAADIQHTYARYGQTFHARVTVYSSDFSGGKTSADCTATAITPSQPALRCIGVVATYTSNPLIIKLTASAQPTNTTITGYTFTYSDGSQPVVAATHKTSWTDTHTFGQNNTTYQVTVTVRGQTADGQAITATTCSARITTPAQNQCKPGVAAGSPQCNVQQCQYNAQLLSTDSNCQPPKELLNTGPGPVIGVAAGVSVFGAVTRLYFLRRKFSL